MPARYWFPIVCAGLSIGLVACQTTQTGAPPAASAPAPAVTAGKAPPHPFDEAIFVGCLPAVTAGNPIQDFADHLKMRPAPAGSAQLMNTPPDKTFAKTIPEGELFMGMAAPNMCVVAAPKVTDVIAVQKAVEDFLIGPGAPFVLTRSEDSRGPRGNTISQRQYEGAIGRNNLIVTLAVSPDATRSLQAYASILRRN